MGVYEKLAVVQKALKAPKNQRNSFGGYNYRSCEDILEAAKPLCVDNGLLLTITDDIRMVGDRVYVMATATVADVKESTQVSVNAFAREPLDKKGSDASQITGAASSYARKYALNGLFCIDDTKDADATNTHETAPKESKKTTTKNNAKADDEVKNEQMRASANDPYKLPEIAGGAPVAEKREKFMQEIKRTGYKPGPIFAMFNCKTLDEMSDEQLVRALERFEAVASKEEVSAKKGQ